MESPARRKARRRRCQKNGAAMAVIELVTGVVGDRHRTEPPQRRDLLGVKACRTVQSGYENDRQVVRHNIRSFQRGPAPQRKNEVIRLT